MRSFNIGDRVRTSVLFEGNFYRDIYCTILDVIGENLKLRYDEFEFYRQKTECIHEDEESAVEYLFRKYMDRGQVLYLSDFIEASIIEDKNPLQ